MAPIPPPSIKALLTTLLKRIPTPSTTSASLIERTALILPRATLANPGSGVTPPTSIPNLVVFIFFGLIGAGIVVTTIWFFFWAKNGGFYFKKNDWDDYKSTVLRRKGPNGTTLSGATESTDLGGGSVVHGEKKKGGRSLWGGRKRKEKPYKDFDEDESTVGGSTVLGSEVLGSEVSGLKRNVRKERKRKGKGKGKKGTNTVTDSEVGTAVGEGEEMDVGVAEAVRAYRHEKPARVGGLNKESEASQWDGSTNDNSTAASELLSHREATPTSTPTKSKRERKDNYTGASGAAGGIRKVMPSVKASEPASTVAYTAASAITETSRMLEENPIKVEARRLQEKGRAAQRRDFSFRVGDDGSTVASERREERERRRQSRSPVKKLAGSFYEESVVSESVVSESVLGSELSRDIGTKSYHHPIPGLSSSGGSDYTQERRKKRNGAGYRRGRDEDVD